MLTINNINFSRGSRKILKNISVHCVPGSVTAILGPNGAGKSSLLQLICAEMQADSGEILWNGQSVFEGNPRDHARERAVLTQRTIINEPFPVEEVVMMGRYPHFNHSPSAEDREIVKEAMDASEVTAFGKTPITRLSGGEQQRVHLARVLAQVQGASSTPRLLLLDEPTNNLDIPFQHKLLSVARKFASEGNTVVAVLHDINLAAQYADYLLLINNGSVLEYGPTESVFNSETLSNCYNYPIQVFPHPVHGLPVAYFSAATQSTISTETFQLKHCI